MNAFVNHKKQSALQKGMKTLLARQKVTEGKITTLGTQMVSVAQTSLKEIERLQTDIMERDVSKYQQLLVDLDHPMDGIDTLSSGLLSHTIIPPGKLAELLNHVKRKLMEHFKQNKLAMIEIHQYYDLPLVSYSYTDDTLILQILICVKHYKQQVLELFNLQTVTVSYMSSSIYLTLDSKQLSNCRF